MFIMHFHIYIKPHLRRNSEAKYNQIYFKDENMNIIGTMLMIIQLFRGRAKKFIAHVIVFFFHYTSKKIKTKILRNMGPGRFLAHLFDYELDHRE